MLPNFVIIGAQKAGSTYLLEGLSSHPDVFMTPGEDPYFQDPEYDQTPREEFERRYESGRGKTAVGLKRPSYLALPECAARIREDLPDARLIAVLRHPVERAVSGYYHYMASGFIPVRPLNEGLRAILDGELQKRFPAAHHILDFSMYGKHLQRYLVLFPRDALLVVLFEDLKRDGLAALRQCYRFLGVDDAYTPPPATLKRRPMQTVRSLPRLRFVQMTRPLYVRFNKDRTRNYSRPGPLAPLIRKATLGIDRYILGRILRNTGDSLDPEVRSRLSDVFRPDIRLLEQLLGRSLDVWS